MEGSNTPDWLREAEAREASSSALWSWCDWDLWTCHCLLGNWVTAVVSENRGRTDVLPYEWTGCSDKATTSQLNGEPPPNRGGGEGVIVKVTEDRAEREKEKDKHRRHHLISFSIENEHTALWETLLGNPVSERCFCKPPSGGKSCNLSVKNNSVAVYSFLCRPLAMIHRSGICYRVCLHEREREVWSDGTQEVLTLAERQEGSWGRNSLTEYVHARNMWCKT